MKNRNPRSVAIEIPLPRRVRERPWSALATAYLLFAAVQPRNGFAGLDLCFFHLATGLPCPTCGLTRGLSHLLILDAPGAFAWNPASFAALPALLFFLFLFAAPARSHASVVTQIRAKTGLIVPTVAAAGFALILLGAARALAVKSGFAHFPFY